MSDTRTARTEPATAASGSAIAPHGTRPPRTAAQTSLDFYGRRRIGFIVLGGAARDHGRCRCSRASSTSASTSRAASSWDVPAAIVHDRRRRADPRATTGSSAERGADPGAQLRQRRPHQGPGRRPAGRGPRRSCEAFAEAAGVDPTRSASTSVELDVGRGDHRQGDPRAGRLPRPGRRVHLDPLRVADGARGDHRHGPRRRRSASGSTRCSASWSRRRRSIAFLTILGYSLYDTIVVFDRIRENEAPVRARTRLPSADLINVSTNQVLMRSLNTSSRRSSRCCRCWSSAPGSSGQMTLQRVRHRAAGRHGHRRLLVDLRRRAAARLSQAARSEVADAAGAERRLSARTLRAVVIAGRAGRRAAARRRRAAPRRPRPDDGGAPATAGRPAPTVDDAAAAPHRPSAC